MYEVYPPTYHYMWRVHGRHPYTPPTCDKGRNTPLNTWSKRAKWPNPKLWSQDQNTVKIAKKGRFSNAPVPVLHLFGTLLGGCFGAISPPTPPNGVTLLLRPCNYSHTMWCSYWSSKPHLRIVHPWVISATRNLVVSEPPTTGRQPLPCTSCLRASLVCR